MLLTEGKLTLSDGEWLEFQRLTWAPWRPRTTTEFNLMCDLAVERHRIENTSDMGEMYAQATLAMKCGANGELNFPADRRRQEYVKVHGSWPTDDELRVFETGGNAAPTGDRGLKLVR